MATPEFISLQCDHCAGCLAHGDKFLAPHWSGHPFRVVYIGQGGTPSLYHSQSDAYAAGREAGWYIAELELCPTCADAYAIEKASEESI